MIMIKSFLLASVFLLFPVQAGSEAFPGGSILFTDQNGFVWETEDASGWIPSNIKRKLKLEIQTTSNPDFPIFVETEAKDGHYELLPVSREGAIKLGKGLKRKGLI